MLELILGTVFLIYILFIGQLIYGFNRMRRFSKAEFTPKTIQTKNERANLVYAAKIHVKNDGFLKIGMYGDVKF